MQIARPRVIRPTLVMTVTLTALAVLVAFPSLRPVPAIAPGAPLIGDEQPGPAIDGTKAAPALPREATPARPAITEPQLGREPAQPAVVPPPGALGAPTETRQSPLGTTESDARPAKPGPQVMELVDEDPSPQLAPTRRLPPKRGFTE